ncbi:MAG: M2 family metallopeptidase [Mycobacterium leprae]
MLADDLRSLVAGIAADLREKTIVASKAYWELATTGTEAAAAAAAESETAIRVYLSNREVFARLKAAQAAPSGDRLLDRQVDGAYRAFLENQLEESEIAELVRRSSELEQIFASFRGKVGDRALSDNEIRAVLVKSADSAERRSAWRASKQIGEQVAPRLVELVKLRNQVARRLGYQNYYDLQLTLSEIKRADLFALLDELKRLTDAPFAAMKRELDAEQAVRFDIVPEDMRPWHYADPFFQELPTSAEVDLDRFFEGKQLEDLATTFYDGVGLETRGILARSDLYERPAKNQHAFCTDIDHEGDVRVLCNLKPNEYWMSTLLHELGHGVYDLYVDPELPWALRTIAHINSTEAIAMFFGRQTKDADWLQQIAGVPAAEAKNVANTLKRELSRSMLILARWVLVMVYFESQLYENPDQDLNGLWWKLVHELQLVTPPADLSGSEWASKIHLATAPVYYHNYLIGEVTASHIHHHVAKATGTTRVVGNQGVGEWLVERWFKPGAIYSWTELVEHATGEPLSPKYFVEQFVG